MFLAGRIGRSIAAATLLTVLCGLTTASTLPQRDVVGLRQIIVSSEQDAVEIRQRTLDGISFEVLAGERSLGSSAQAGGYLGRVSLSELRGEFQDALISLSPGAVTPPIRVGDEYFLLQIVPDAEMEWIDLDEAGARALAQGRDAEAAEYFEAAVEKAEALASGDLRLARSLDSLATVKRMLGRPEEAESLHRRALVLLPEPGASDGETAQALNGLGMALAAQGRNLEAEQAYLQARAIRERVFGPDHPEVVGTLHNLAELYATENRYIEAASLYEQSLALLEASLGPSHPATIASAGSLRAFRSALMPALLDRFSTIVGLSEFRDRDFEETLAEVLALLPLAPLSEVSYVQIKDILLEVGLTEETEQVLLLGLEQFPDSRILRIYMADLMAGTGRTAIAVDVLREASRLPTPEGLDSATDKQQLGVIYQRIGDIESALTHFEEAITAYQQSLEIDAASPGGRMKLGRVYLRDGRVEEGIAELERAARETADDDEVHLSLAEAYLAHGQWDETAVAAQRAIDLGTTDSRALYLLGTALLRTGERDRGQESLREFASVSEGFSELEHENREVDAISVSAIGALREGDSGHAVEALSEGIELFPNAGRLRMNLAMVLSRLERHEAAVDVLESMLELGIGRTFIVHKNLADEYEALGDLEASDRHRDIYLETREAELIVYAPE